MSIEENKALIRYVFDELFNQGNLDVADELFSPDYHGHHAGLATDIHGPEGFKQLVVLYRSTFPDLHVTIEDQIAERDKVVSRFTFHGTHQGTLVTRSRTGASHQGGFVVLAPTGKRVTVEGISIARIGEGTRKESWTIIDRMGMMVQLDADSRVATSPALFSNL
jgi:predicted ester cyclase